MDQREVRRRRWAIWGMMTLCRWSGLWGYAFARARTAGEGSCDILAVCYCWSFDGTNVERMALSLRFRCLCVRDVLSESPVLGHAETFLTYTYFDAAYFSVFGDRKQSEFGENHSYIDT